MHLRAESLCETVAALWGADIIQSAPEAVSSNGLIALGRYGGLGARDHAAAGFPVIRLHALPALRTAINDGFCQREARVQTLFSIMAVLDDTNLLHRGGQAGLDFVRCKSKAFLAAGGVRSDNWQMDALDLHAACVRRHLSPGGAADLLAAAIFLHDMETRQ
uniref:triphosphoribosyl-dephospho-CoA synthase n=1 Tax=Brucella intermedia TaxID=94625 RepID=UPI00224B1AB3